MSSGRAGRAPICPVRPEHQNTNAIDTQGEVEGGDEVKDELVTRADDLLRRIKELEEKLIREEGRRPIVSPVPDRPTEEEVREHNVTHTPRNRGAHIARLQQEHGIRTTKSGRKCRM